eukprot:TRINITY_DN38643_c0_g1_i1.p1 TRINITY_DN38643_c0_g1~~TRINITY_DN38643_c0_g1_i1.p1  ORF type:complete len:315 (-),score=47.62 TRINITY_DN38643_c0_g1_i1:17-961(-)
MLSHFALPLLLLHTGLAHDQASKASKAEASNRRLLKSLEAALQGLDDDELYSIVGSLLRERRELRERLLSDSPRQSVAKEAEPVQTHSQDNIKSAATAHQDFVFTLLGVKTSRQQWTPKGFLPNKTLNVAVKYRVAHSAGEPYASCVVAKAMGEAVTCNISDVGGLNGSSYPWYNTMYDIMVNDYLLVSKDLPQQIYWELVNLAMAKRFLAEFDGSSKDRPKIIGVSTLMQVDGTAQLATPGSAEVQGLQPGNHGTLVTIGEIEPLDYNILSFSNIYRGTFPSDPSVAPMGNGWMASDQPEKWPGWSPRPPNWL